MALLAELTGGSLFLVIFVVVTAFVLMLRTQRQLRQPSKQARPGDSPSNTRVEKRLSSGRQEMKVQPQVEHWEVRMHDMARELSAQLDSKMSALEHLIQDAERQIVRLDERLGRKPEGFRQPAAASVPPAANPCAAHHTRKRLP